MRRAIAGRLLAGRSLAVRILALAAILVGLCAADAFAKPRIRGASKSAKAKKGRRDLDPAHWFATRQGLIRVYQERGKGRGRKADTTRAAGASCEVIESVPAGGERAAASTRELCSMIVDKKPKHATTLTYELRKTGIFRVRIEAPGAGATSGATGTSATSGASGASAPPAADEHLLLPGPLRVGSSWKEPAGEDTVLERRVKSAGAPCRAAGRSFGDCLVVSVVRRGDGKVQKKFSETYAAGVGLVEDAQWQLIDVKGL